MNNENELTAALLTIEKSKEASGCPTGVDLQDWVKQLAADNLAMKQAIDQHRCGFVVCPSCSLEISSSTDDVCYVLNGTPATDRILAEAEARGVEKLAMRRRAAAKVALDEFNDVKNHAELESEAWRAEMFASELREGAK
ncbi:TPA: hypothetical protein MBF38_000679 [Klebsiella aerogenes]|nr:hypothetical protein [Klebsiella aerogenes]